MNNTINIFYFFLLKFVRLIFKKSINNPEIYKENDLILKNCGILKLFLIKSGQSYTVNFPQKSILRAFTSDFLVFNQVILNQEYFSVLSFFKLNGLIPTSMIDCGANIGLTSIYFKSFYPSLKIYALEPDKENFRLLKLNLENYSGVVLDNAAIWSSDAKLVQRNCHRNVSNWEKSFQDVNEFSEVGDFDGITFSTVFKKSGFQIIDFLKVDIEGAEFEVFRISINIEFLEKVRFISIEIHQQEGNIDKLIKVFLDKGFYLIASGEFIIGVNKNLISRI